MSHLDKKFNVDLIKIIVTIEHFQLNFSTPSQQSPLVINSCPNPPLMSEYSLFP